MTIHYRRSDRVLWRRTLDAVLLLPPSPRGDARAAQRESQREVLSLGGAGPLLWELLAQERTVPQLASALAQQYDAGVDRVTRDIVPVLDTLTARHAVSCVRLP